MTVYPKNWTENYIIAYGILGSVSNIDPDKVYDYHTAFEIKSTKMKMNVDINMNGKIISNTPSLKQFIFALPGKFNRSTDGKYVYFGGTKVIIAPVICRMIKCFVYSESSLSHKLMRNIESTNSQNQCTQSYSYLGTQNKYTSHTFYVGNLINICLRNEDIKLT